MGNATKSSCFHNPLLLQPPSESFSFLLNLQQPLITQTLSRLKSFCHKSFVTKNEFKSLFQDTVLENQMEFIFRAFSTSCTVVNIYELLAAIMTYSDLSWQDKVSLLFKLFDFDNSNLLTADELAIMLKCWLKGIQRVIGCHFPVSFENTNSKEAFFGLYNTDGVSLNNLLAWVQSQRTLLSLLRKYSKKRTISQNLPNFFSKSFDREKIAGMKSRRFSNHNSDLKTRKQIITELFLKTCNRSKKAQAGNLYNAMSKDPRFSAESEIFFSMFSFKLKTELDLREFLEVYRLVKLEKQRKNEDKVKYEKNGRVSSMDRSERDKVELVKRIFKRYDINGDGVINCYELKYGMKKFLSREAAEELFNEYDLDNNKKLDIDEFFCLFGCKPRSKINM